MRPCSVEQLTVKPFAAEHRVLAVGEDRVAREVVLGGAGRFVSQASLTLFLPSDAGFPVGANLTVNLLPAGRRADAPNHYEAGQRVRAPLIAESRLAFECLVIASGTLDGEHAKQSVVVARVLLAHQRWPRGCAIT
jgi:hypothetical protein